MLFACICFVVAVSYLLVTWHCCHLELLISECVEIRIWFLCSLKLATYLRTASSISLPSTGIAVLCYRVQGRSWSSGLCAYKASAVPNWTIFLIPDQLDIKHKSCLFVCLFVFCLGFINLSFCCYLIIVCDDYLQFLEAVPYYTAKWRLVSNSPSSLQKYFVTLSSLYFFNYFVCLSYCAVSIEWAATEC